MTKPEANPTTAPPIRRAAVLGAGTMGRTIAAHLANCGLQVELLDIVPKDAPAKGPERDAYSRGALTAMVKQRPPAWMDRAFAARVRAGNLDDHLERLRGVDWVIEVVIERADLKLALYGKIEPYLGEHTILSSNTSGISIAQLAEGLSEGRRARFLGTHFFNPPRYLYLLELIAGPSTDPALMASMTVFGENVLGKGVVIAKDRPNFVANRIGTFGMLRTVQLMREHGLSVTEVDFLTGPFAGRAKSATFRTVDLVGLDVLLHVADNVVQGAPDDPQLDVFRPDPLLTKMVEKGLLGEKSKQGFYKKSVVDGKKAILSLDPSTFEYVASKPVEFPELDAFRKIADPAERVAAAIEAEGRGAAFLRQLTLDTLQYSAQLAPEIAFDLSSVDRALRWGFAWEKGPFEIWDAIGLSPAADAMGDLPAWLQSHMKAGAKSLYNEDGGTLDLSGKGIVPAANRPGVWELPHRAPREVRQIEGNKSATLWDLGQNILGLELHGKMNTLGTDAVGLGLKAQCMAEGEWDGLVVGGRGPNFSAGADLRQMLGAIGEKRFDDIDTMVRRFQQFTVGMRRLTRPVVVAPYNLALGGGCELSMHAHRLVSHAELYTGLVEIGVGLLPAGGGTKEFYLRMLQRQTGKPDPIAAAKAAFEAIGMAKVSGSAHEARSLGFLSEGDIVAPNRDRLWKAARDQAVALAAAGFTPEPAPVAIPVGGDETRGLIEVALFNLSDGHYATDYDAHIGRKVGLVLSGGESRLRPGFATEQELLDLEREGFLSLCGHPNTAARIETMLKTGKPLRN